MHQPGNGRQQQNITGNPYSRGPQHNNNGPNYPLQQQYNTMAGGYDASYNVKTHSYDGLDAATVAAVAAGGVVVNSHNINAHPGGVNNMVNSKYMGDATGHVLDGNVVHAMNATGVNVTATQDGGKMAGNTNIRKKPNSRQGGPGNYNPGGVANTFTNNTPGAGNSFNGGVNAYSNGGAYRNAYQDGAMQVQVQGAVNQALNAMPPSAPLSQSMLAP